MSHKFEALGRFGSLAVTQSRTNIDHGLMTASEVENLAKQEASQVGQVIKEFASDKPWLRGGFTWFDESDFQKGAILPWAA